MGNVPLARGENMNEEKENLKNKYAGGGRIRFWREAAGLTQNNVLGIPIRTIQHWEKGDRECAPWLEDLIVEKLVKKALLRCEELLRADAPEAEAVCWTFHGDGSGDTAHPRRKTPAEAFRDAHAAGMKGTVVAEAIDAEGSIILTGTSFSWPTQFAPDVRLLLGKE